MDLAGVMIPPPPPSRPQAGFPELAEEGALEIIIIKTTGDKVRARAPLPVPLPQHQQRHHVHAAPLRPCLGTPAWPHTRLAAAAVHRS